MLFITSSSCTLCCSQLRAVPPNHVFFFFPLNCWGSCSSQESLPSSVSRLESYRLHRLRWPRIYIRMIFHLDLHPYLCLSQPVCSWHAPESGKGEESSEVKKQQQQNNINMFQRSLCIIHKIYLHDVDFTEQKCFFQGKKCLMEHIEEKPETFLPSLFHWNFCRTILYNGANCHWAPTNIQLKTQHCIVGGRADPRLPCTGRSVWNSLPGGEPEGE